MTITLNARWIAIVAAAVGLGACAPRAPRPPAPAPSPVAEAPPSGPVESPASEPEEAELPPTDETELLLETETAMDAGPPDGGRADAGVVATSSDATADAGEPSAPAPPAECTSERWGGWEGTPQCRAAARRQIPGAHRRCETDEDCVFVARGCEQHVVNRRYEARYRRWRGPCVGPGAGQCSGPTTVICAQGCCYPDHGLGLPR